MASFTLLSWDPGLRPISWVQRGRRNGSLKKRLRLIGRGCIVTRSGAGGAVTRRAGSGPDRIREYLGWEDVRTQLREQHVDDPLRLETVSTYSETARKGIPEAIQQAYSLVVTVSDKNEVQAFKITVESGKPLFEQIKADSRSRIQDTPISAEALLPDGPYNLWRAGETSRRVKDLVGAFAQFPHLPKMLNRKAILDTLTGGCVEGMFVLRLTRADRAVKTFWRELPDEIALKDPSLEVLLPEVATLTVLSPRLLAPGACLGSGRPF